MIGDEEAAMAKRASGTNREFSDLIFILEFLYSRVYPAFSGYTLLYQAYLHQRYKKIKKTYAVRRIK